MQLSEDDTVNVLSVINLLDGSECRNLNNDFSLNVVYHGRTFFKEKKTLLCLRIRVDHSNWTNSWSHSEIYEYR